MAELDDIDLDDVFPDDPPAVVDPIEDEPEETNPEGGAEPIGDGATPPSDAAKFAALEARIAELSGKASAGDEIKELTGLAREFFTRQSQPNAPAPDPAASERDLVNWGTRVQELAVTGTPKELATFLLQSINEVADKKVSDALATHGTPLAEKTANYTVRSFLADKRDAAGEGGAKLHTAIAKNLEFTGPEKAWIAQQNDAVATAFMERKYREAAGQVLLSSAGKARPKDISSGTGGGGKGGSVTPFPGLGAREQRQIERLAASYWPDPAVRATKMKGLIASMSAEGA